MAASHPRSFSKYLTLMIVTLVTGTVVVISLMFYLYFGFRLESEFRNKLLSEKGQVEVVLENRVNEVYRGLQALAKDNTIRVTMMLNDTSQLKFRVNQMESIAHGVAFFVRMKKTGEVVYQRGGELYGQQAHQMFDALPQGQYRHINDQDCLIWCFGMPIVDRDRQMGSVFIIYDMMQDRQLSEAVRDATGGDVGVITPTGLLGVLSRAMLPIDAKLELPGESDRPFRIASSEWAVSSLRNSPATFLVSSRKELIEEKTGLSVVMGLSCFWVLVLSLSISIFLARQLSRPLGEMANKAIQISEGNKKVVFGTSTMTFVEFRVLNQAFDHMLFNLINAEEKSRYNELLANVDDAVYLVDGQGDIIMANEATYLRLGYAAEDFSKTTLSDLIPFLDIDEFNRQLTFENDRQKMLKITVTTSHRHKDGTLLPVEINSRAIAYRGKPVLLHVARDLTAQLKAEKEKKKLEEQLFQAQKMQAIGTLAGGVAHDFNNLLMAIQGRISLIRLDTKLDGHFGQYVDEIEKTVQNAANLTRQLLGFARGGKYQAKSTHLNELIEKSVRMFQRTRREIKVHTKFEMALQTVYVDHAQIEQVMLNLFLNAAHAMAEKGDLYIETKNCVLAPADCVGQGIPPGDYISVSVTDTGVGMDEETTGRVFEPFFTTKPLGEGTGLGLASVYGIIKNHKGTIRAVSKKDRGSTFQFFLPASDETIQKDPEHKIKLSRGHETILLVDDQPEVIDVGLLMLTELGYEVVIADSGKKALTLLRENTNMPDLVILDMIMPGMTGQEVFNAIRAIRPEMKILLCSGYGLNFKAQELLALGCNGFIEKPFDIFKLSQKVREVIEFQDQAVPPN